MKIKINNKIVGNGLPTVTDSKAIEKTEWTGVHSLQRKIKLIIKM